MIRCYMRKYFLCASGIFRFTFKKNSIALVPARNNTVTAFCINKISVNYGPSSLQQIHVSKADPQAFVNETHGIILMPYFSALKIVFGESINKLAFKQAKPCGLNGSLEAQRNMQHVVSRSCDWLFLSRFLRGANSLSCVTQFWVMPFDKVLFVALGGEESKTFGNENCNRSSRNKNSCLLNAIPKELNTY